MKSLRNIWKSWFSAVPIDQASWMDWSFQETKPNLPRETRSAHGLMAWDSILKFSEWRDASGEKGTFESMKYFRIVHSLTRYVSSCVPNREKSAIFEWWRSQWKFMYWFPDSTYKNIRKGEVSDSLTQLHEMCLFIYSGHPECPKKIELGEIEEDK